MSSAADTCAQALRYEYESLSQEASSLATNLARRRADVALMRAEAATVAVSLEAAKEELDDLLRKEATIRTNAPLSPNADRAGADFFPDQGLVRSLAGQLEVTRSSVKAALQRKLSMQNEIDRLEKLVEASRRPQPNSGQQAGDVRDESALLRLKDKAPSARVNFVSGQFDVGDTSSEHSLTDNVLVAERRRNARSSLEENVVRVLKDGAESKSSFRFDHARIWRDVTMPNLALVLQDADNLSAAQVSLGVVMERIFEGVTCFTPTNAAEKGKRSSASDLRIESSGGIRETHVDMADVVSKHFGTLTASARDEPKQVRIIAPKAALSRVMDLICDDDSDRSRRPPPQLPLHDYETQTGPDGKASEDASSSLPSSAPARGRSQEVVVSVKLSDPSHVLQKEHFNQIMSQGVPIRFHESGMELVYSTNVHGMSLHTLFNRVKTTSPTLVAIRDTKDRVFGCYAAAPWKSSATRYYGTGESFVFGTDGPSIAKVYKWSRENSFFQFTSSTFLAIGGGAGSHFALWVDEDLLMGTTSACSTFASPALTSINEEDAPSCIEFKIVSLEVWGFNAHVRH